jgi:hypothetical protein
LFFSHHWYCFGRSLLAFVEAQSNCRASSSSSSSSSKKPFFSFDEMRSSRLNKIFLSRRDEMKNNKETARRRLAWDDAI